MDGGVYIRPLSGDDFVTIHTGSEPTTSKARAIKPRWRRIVTTLFVMKDTPATPVLFLGPYVRDRLPLMSFSPGAHNY